ncbi:surface-associated interspersed protein 8.2 (SURFIN 8.2) (SURF8.2), partial [Plasmodium malariae]
PKLKSIRRKNEFREKCLRFAEYVIEKKYKNPPIFKQENWEAALKTWVKHYFFKEKTKYGICPVIFEQNDRDLLELTYKAEDFFEKKEKEIKKIKHLKEKKEISNNCINDHKCKRSCEEYNEWIISMKKEFDGKKVFILDNSNKEFTKLKNKKTLSDLVKSDTFEEIPNCSYRETVVNVELVSEEKEEVPVGKPGGAPKEQIMSSSGEDGHSMEAAVPSERNDQMPQETSTSHSYQVQREKESLPEDPPKDTETNNGENAQYAPESMLQIPGDSGTTVEGNVILHQEKPLTDVHATTFTPAALSIPNLPSVTSDILKKPGLFNKKKKIKRREVKFLRILVPSYYNRNKFLRHNHLEYPINEEEENIKKIKIQEHNMNKNENVSYGKKDRSITIIEQYANKEWEYNKGEFLAICQEVLTKKENRTYTNLKDDEVVMDNIKSTNEIEKQKSLWSKWVERHKMFLEKLRKKDWFNNLKNDWKEERSYIENSEKLR